MCCMDLQFFLTLLLSQERIILPFHSIWACLCDFLLVNGMQHKWHAWPALLAPKIQLQPDPSYLRCLLLGLTHHAVGHIKEAPRECPVHSPVDSWIWMASASRHGGSELVHATACKHVGPWMSKDCLAKPGQLWALSETVMMVMLLIVL